ncbi:MAG: hypothetical protein ACE5LB_05890 [Acidiferrobacterales bacterium]
MSAKRARKPKKVGGRPSAGRRQEARFRFKKADKDQLLAVLREKLRLSPRSKAVTTFIQAAELAITGFGAYRELEKGRPSARSIEAKLRQFKRQTSELKKAMDSMDADTRFHLELCLQTPMFHIADAKMRKKSLKKAHALAMIEAASRGRLAVQAFIDRLTQDLATLEVATAVAATAPQHAQSGRTREHWRLELAADIARAFRDCLKVDPKKSETTKEVPFTSVLRICLSAAGVHVQDLRRLALEAVRRVEVQEAK